MTETPAARPRKKPISIRGISEVTGFSTTTVSMVLNGRAGEFNISEDTTKLILAKAKELNYQPNLHARSLRAGRTDIVGLMVPTLRNHFFGEMAETFEVLARSEQKLALIFVTQYERSEELSAINYFLAQQADCVFVANPMDIEAISAACARGGARQIYLDTEANPVNTVSTDNYGAALELTRSIIASMRAKARGGRLYYFGGMADHKVTQLRLAAFRAGLAEAGLPFDESQVIWSPFQSDAAHTAAAELFAARDDIGGLFVNSMLSMEGLVRYFPQNRAACIDVHYGVFDYHPYLGMLSDLNVISVKQDSIGIMRAAFDLFRQPSPPDAGTIVNVPHELIVTPSAR
jgi:DNA-binding LacI/PurR family transcriptional regulator